jgi:hypothetical protein
VNQLDGKVLVYFLPQACDVYHEPIMAGDVTLCFALSESDAGSDEEGANHQQ